MNYIIRSAGWRAQAIVSMINGRHLIEMYLDS